MRKLETQDGYQPDQQVVSDVWDYAGETGNGFDHVLGWMRVLNAFGAVTGMTAAEAQGFADRGSGWERWVPVAAELAELEAAESEAEASEEEAAEEEESEEEESEEDDASFDQSDEPADPVFFAAALGFTIAEDHADGASVGTVTATDANGDTLTYSLTSTDTAPFPLNVALFTINSATGEISVASGVQLDFETQQTHLVEVGVSDDGNDADGNPETTATVDATIWVTIRVIDVEDDELRTARQATLPMACGAAGTLPGLSAVTSSASTVTWTYEALTPGHNSGLRIFLCRPAPTETDPNAYTRDPTDIHYNDTSSYPSVGATDTLSGLTPDTDYWAAGRQLPRQRAVALRQDQGPAGEQHGADRRKRLQRQLHLHPGPDLHDRQPRGRLHAHRRRPVGQLMDTQFRLHGQHLLDDQRRHPGFLAPHADQPGLADRWRGQRVRGARGRHADCADHLCAGAGGVGQRPGRCLQHDDQRRGQRRGERLEHRRQPALDENHGYVVVHCQPESSRSGSAPRPSPRRARPPPSPSPPARRR